MNQKCTSLDVSDIISRLVKAKDQIRGKFPLSQDEVTSLCSAFKSVLIIQPLLLELVPPLHICGDIHGQYSDLLNIFQRLGEPSSHNYLFLGDYVDRGKKSLESICLLMACKVKHPLTFFLLRGNHQSSKLNKTYGFYDQCKRKMGIKAFKTITEAFNYLPVCAVVGQRIFCVHGGLSPLVDQLSAINCIKRPVQIEDNKIISDLLWSDPNPKLQGWEFNFERGVSVTYGKRVLDSFLKKYDFDFVCRSHQVVEEGYQFLHARTLLTVFSVPNYCGQFQNFGAVLSITADMVCSLVQLKGNVNHSGKIQRKLTPLKAVSYDELKEKSNKMSEKEAVLNDQKASVASRKQTLYPQDLNVLVQQKLGQVDARMQLREQNCQKK